MLTIILIAFAVICLIFLMCIFLYGINSAVKEINRIIGMK